MQLDILRGGAAVAVFINHWRNLTLVDSRDLRIPNLATKMLYFATGFGHQAVVVFFVLSGYLVGTAVVRAEWGGTWSWSAFAAARLSRLLIVLWPALVLQTILDTLGMHLFGIGSVYSGAWGNVQSGPVASRLSLGIGLGNAFFLQEILCPTFGSNSPLWSLSYEFWYYLAFPFGVQLLSWRRSISERLLALTASCAIALFVGSGVRSMAPLWLLGVVVGCASRRRWTLLARRVFGSVTAALAVSALALARLGKFTEIGALASDYVVGICVALFIYSLVTARESPAPHGVALRLATFMARSSYTLYLVHLPALMFAVAASRQEARWEPGTRASAFAWVILGVVYCYVVVVYALFERRTETLRALFNKILSRVPVHEHALPK
jgi:peptidoglycan/LPS O-acetylase OafA/YrhL